MSIPVMRSSVLAEGSRSILTSGRQSTWNLTFWPMKLTTSRDRPPVAICTLVGKCAYTIFMRYLKPLVTPSIMFWMWEQVVLMTASSLDLANHFSTLTSFGFGMYRSMDMCLKLLVREPRGPVTFTTRDFTVTSTFSGTLTEPFTFTCFMFTQVWQVPPC